MRRMSTNRISQAMDRIERALARIETQAALSGHPTESADSENTELARKHEALRKSVSTSLDELDTLLGTLGK